MSNHRVNTLRRFFASTSKKRQPPRRSTGFRRTLGMEVLEQRQMLSITPLQSVSWAQDTGEKPQSKVFEYANQWWTVMPNSSGTWIYRLSGASWTASQQITTSNNTHADVKLVGDLAHVLLYSGASSQLATLEYDPVDNRFEPWSANPQPVRVPLSSGVETATLDVDSTGRMWIASDASSTVEVRYSDGPYTTWSAPITVGSNITSDDISAIIAMPNNTVGVFWSNQNKDRFGFRVHQDGAAPTAWSGDEVPASQSALSKGAGMADDHMHLAVASDGTLYAAVKTSYDSSGYPEIALLVRRPNGAWDNLYSVDTKGTRPIVVLDEVANKLVVAYTSQDGGGDILYRESPLGNISFGSRQTLISGSENNVTSAKSTSSNQIVFLAGKKGALLTYGTTPPPPPVNQAPLVSAGPDLAGSIGSPVALDGTVTDDNLPTPPSLVTSWTKISGPGTVSFGNSALVDTSATFSAAGTYVIQLTANDGQLSRADTVTVVIADSPTQPPTEPPPGSDPVQIAFQDGLFPSVTYAGTRDTKISSDKASTNYGNSQSINIDGSPDTAALFKWDISAIPTGSVIVSAAIDLYVTSSTSDHYEVYALQKAWDELSATWQRYASGQSWTRAGASGSGDHGTAVLGALNRASTGTYRITLNAAGIAAVQAWLNNPNTNFGVILQNYSVSDGLDVSTSETGTASRRPKLIVNYRPNLAPLVQAGPNQSIPFGSAATLAPTIADDGQPVGGSLIVLWTPVSGPGQATFASPTSPNTTVTFSAPGGYKLRLTVSDGLLSAFDELDINVA